MLLNRCDNARGWDGASSFNLTPKCENSRGVNVVDVPELGDTWFLCDQCFTRLKLDALQNKYEVKLVRRLRDEGVQS